MLGSVAAGECHRLHTFDEHTGSGQQLHAVDNDEWTTIHAARVAAENSSFAVKWREVQFSPRNENQAGL
ncbi:MAG: hypothetical protein P1P76_10920 [Anaerolineales bacterium]|nr:hypothetical protein [Anaerolineales bacterium]